MTTGSVPASANEFIEQELVRLLERVEQSFDADAMTLSGPLVFGVDNVVYKVIEELKDKRSERRDRFAVILTTEGGYIETVQRIVETIRHNYSHVCIVIPDYAFSAGTVLAMSGDDIHMHYFSRMGPIDPQVEGENGRAAPALGYLEKWNELLKKAKKGTITVPEIQVMLTKFDQAELYQYEQARELSITLLEEWLAKYKFKDWERTETRQIDVNDAMRKRRAKEIGRLLNNTNKWHSHGRGIPMSTLRGELNLKIDDLADSPERHSAVKCYHGLMDDYMQRRAHLGAVHTRYRYQAYVHDHHDHVHA